MALAVIDNFIKPLAMRHGTGLPTLALFFGLAGGLEAYGPIGIFAGPAVIAIFVALLRVYERIYVANHEAATTVVATAPTVTRIEPAMVLESEPAPELKQTPELTPMPELKEKTP